VKEAEHQRFMLPVLEAAGIPYLTLSADEFNEMLSPAGTLDLFSWLKFKLGVEDLDLV